MNEPPTRAPDDPWAVVEPWVLGAHVEVEPLFADQPEEAPVGWRGGPATVVEPARRPTHTERNCPLVEFADGARVRVSPTRLSVAP